MRKPTKRAPKKPPDEIAVAIRALADAVCEVASALKPANGGGGPGATPKEPEQPTSGL